MKTNAIVRIVIFSLAIILLVGILASVMLLDLYIVDGKVQQGKQEAVEPLMSLAQFCFVSSQIRNIEIEWAAGDITIQPDENATDIQITEYSPSGSDYPMVCRQSGQTLKIQFSEESIKFPSFGISTDISKDLVITVPADWGCETLEIDAASAQVDIHDLQINEVDFDGASGMLILDHCDIVMLDIDTASGDVEFSGTLNDLDFDAASSSFRGEFTESPQHLYMDTMSGDLELILPENRGFTCQLDAMSGSFSSDFETETNNGTYICGDGYCEIQVSAMSGDVEILKGITTSGESSQ